MTLEKKEKEKRVEPKLCDLKSECEPSVSQEKKPLGSRMRELLEMAKGTPGDTRGLRGLLSLEDHPDFNEIFQSGNVEDDYDVEKEPIAR